MEILGVSLGGPAHSGEIVLLHAPIKSQPCDTLRDFVLLYAFSLDSFPDCDIVSA
jgi:hypothetical protein